MSDLASLFGISGETSVESDRGAYAALPTDIYDATVKYAYMDTSSGENKSPYVKVVLDVKGKTIESDSLWIVNKETKKPYKVENGKPVYTYGWQVFNSLAIAATGIDASKLTTEKKVISKYNYDAKKDMPVEVICFTELTNKKIKVGIKELKKHVRAQINGVWKPTTKLKSVNTIDKYYNIDGKTAAEFVSGKDAEYGAKWLASYKGIEFDENLKEDPVEVADAPKGNAPAVAPAQSAASLLFND